ncbi:hypothetical protein BIW11_07337 [Tropilaelaps mercedesae]|uniref:Uncharacterized protein n=1 Tax=Tropilaelaps mercedesae TaxID=418985 RepID=A0A1V9XUC2_9ACAR|nr:hypothetical protein BIW11_07337 [Tropilaelaps mercedesae]
MPLPLLVPLNVKSPQGDAVAKPLLGYEIYQTLRKQCCMAMRFPNCANQPWNPQRQRFRPHWHNCRIGAILTGGTRQPSKRPMVYFFLTALSHRIRDTAPTSWIILKVPPRYYAKIAPTEPCTWHDPGYQPTQQGICKTYI